jgi:hypothetical protein
MDLAGALKQAPGSTCSEHNAYEGAKREIERAGIKHCLKGIAHMHFSFEPSSPMRAHPSGRTAGGRSASQVLSLDVVVGQDTQRRAVHIVILMVAD